MRQTIEIQIEAPDGYEATGEYRQADFGEFIELNGKVDQWKDHTLTTDRYIILRKKFVWPEWLKAAAIAMTPAGTWWAATNTPKLGTSHWLWSGGETVRLSRSLWCIDLPDIPKEQWRESLILNPNLEGGE